MTELQPDEYAFLSAAEMEALFDKVDAAIGDAGQIEVVGPRGVGKTYFCWAYARRSGRAIGNRALSNRLIRPHMTMTELFGRLFLPRRARTEIRHRVVMRAVSRLTPGERGFVMRLGEVLQVPLQGDLDPERRAALEYCAREMPAAVLRAAHLRNENIRGLLDEGVLKLLLGFLRWYPGAMPSVVAGEIRACLADYPGERCALFLDAPASIVNARRTQRGDPPKSESPHEPSFEMLCSLCEQTGWRVMRVEAWSRG